MFALIDTTGAVHLRANEEMAEDFRQHGSSKHSRMPYWSIPEDVRSDEAALLQWAQRGFEVAPAVKR